MQTSFQINVYFSFWLFVFCTLSLYIVLLDLWQCEPDTLQEANGSNCLSAPELSALSLVGRGRNRHIIEICPFLSLKTLDTISNCQRPVFSLGVSQLMHTITNLWTFELNRSSKLRDNNERKTPLSHEVVCFHMLDFETPISKSEVSKSNSWKITSFFENYVTSEGAVSHNVLYYQYQPPPITHYQVRLYANNYFE